MLWHMNQLYKQRENTAIAQYIPQGPLFCGAWKDFLQRGMNELWGQDGVEFFTWEGPGEGGVYVGKWTLTEDYAPALNIEREREGEVHLHPGLPGQGVWRKQDP